MPSAPQHRHPKYNHPTHIPLHQDQEYPPGFVWDYGSQPWPYSMPLQKPNEIPMQKVYNLDVGAIPNKHFYLNTIYEDVVPGEPYSFSMIKTTERDQISSFIKSSIFKHNQEEAITMKADKDSVNSIHSYFKVLMFNPYGSANKNPYKYLSYNFMIYNMAFPIRYKGGSINIAKNSMGLNLRLYNLNVGALSVTNNKVQLPLGNVASRNLSWYDFDVWREIHYYEFIKNNIVNRKVSPNFVTLILKGLDTQSKLNYNELYSLIDAHSRTGSSELLNLKINNTIDFFNGIRVNSDLITYMNSAGVPANTQVELSTNLIKESGTSLLAVTEAPNYSIHEWASPVYDRYGSQNKMVSTGVHNFDTWLSVLFQVLYSCCVLQENEIYFNGLNFENNFFVKDLFVKHTSVNHWKYKVDNFDFYIPNYGYLVLFDSRFVDLDNSKINSFSGNTRLNLTNDDYTNANQSFKINSPILFQCRDYNPPLDINGTPSGTPPVNIIVTGITPSAPPSSSSILTVTSVISVEKGYRLVNNQYYIDAVVTDVDNTPGANTITIDKNINSSDITSLPINFDFYNPNDKYNDYKTQFNQHVKNMFDSNKELFNNAPFQIKTLINDIASSILPTDHDFKIKSILARHFHQFLHNRIGTPLLKSEMENFDESENAVIREGDLVVYKVRHREFKWAVIDTPNSANGGRRYIITKSNTSKKIERVSVIPSSLKHYSFTEEVLQNKTSNVNLDVTGLIETYQL